MNPMQLFKRFICAIFSGTLFTSQRNESLFRLRKATGMNFFKANGSQASKRAWQSIFSILVVLGLLLGNVAAAQAEPNAPEPMPARKPSPAMQMAAAGIQIAPLLPELLGFEKPHTYLLLLQNNQELRATGGFITAVGRITMDKGRVTELVFDDSYAIVRDDVDHPLAPEPIKRFMNIEILFLRDSNWSPDFPTTARLASQLYAQDVGVQVDGVVTIDLRAVELLVGALAPLEVPGGEVALTGENVLDEIMHFWDRPPTSEVGDEVQTDTLIERKDWLYQRKDFIPLIAESAISRIQSGDFNPMQLIDSITSALNERAVQVWLADPAAAAMMARQGWDGRLRPEAGSDFVALVDTNMGYNKVDAVLERALSHTVTWPNGPEAPAQATVAVTYNHPMDVVDESCSPWTDYGTLASYSGMIGRCYFGYVRLYVPGGSELVSLQGVEVDSISSQAGERGTEVFAGYLSLKPGEEHTVTFTYTLPPTITVDNYQLVVQRQSGAGPLPLAIAVDDTHFDMTLTDGRMLWPATPTLATK